MINPPTATINAFQGLLAQACLYALLLIFGVVVATKILKEIRVAISSLWQKSRFSFAAVGLLSLAMGLWADKTRRNYVIVELCNYVNAGMRN